MAKDLTKYKDASNEQLAQAYQSGEISDEDLKPIYDMKISSGVSKTTLSASPKEAVAAEKPKPFAPKIDRTTLIDQYFKDGTLAPSSDMRQALIDNKITIDQAKEFTKKYNSTLMANEKPATPAGIKETKEDKVSLGDSLMNGISLSAEKKKAFADADAKIKAEGFGFDPLSGKPMLAPNMTAKDKMGALAQGATSGIIESEFTPKTTGEAITYVALNLLGGFAGTMVASAVLGPVIAPVAKVFNKIPGVAKATQSAKLLNETAKLSTSKSVATAAKVASGALKLGAATAENTAIGAGAGFTRGMLKRAKGDESVDPLKYAIADAKLSAIATPVIAGAIKGIGATAKAISPFLPKSMQPNSVLAAKTGKAINKSIDEMGLYEYYGNNGATKEFFDSVKSLGDAGKLTEGNELHNTYKSIKRYEAVEPFTGSAAQLRKIPELLHAAFDDDVEKTATALFIGSADKPAPLKLLYDGDVNVKSLMDAGEWADALDYANTKVVEMVGSKDYQDFAILPYNVGPKELAKAKAQAFARSDRYKSMPGLQEKLLSYYENPTEETANALLGTKGTQTTASGKSMSTVFNQNDLTKMRTYDFHGNLAKRTSWSEADEIAGDITKSWFDQISGVVDGKENRPFLKQNLGRVRDADDVLRASTSFNRDFHRSMIEGYANAVDGAESFGLLDKKSAKDVEEAFHIRNAQESQRITAVKAKSVSADIQDLQKLIKDGVDVDGNKLLLERRINQRTMLQKEINDLGNIISERTANILNNNDNNMNAVASALRQVNDIHVPNARAFSESGDVFVNRFKATDFTEKVNGVNPSGNPELAAKMASVGQAPAEAGVESRLEGMVNFARNPAYVKARSQLADALTAMHVSGVDLKESNFLNTMGGMMSVEKMVRGQLGANNPLEKAVFSRIKESEVFMRQDKLNYMNTLAATGIKRGSKESAMVARYIENGSQPDDEWKSLSPAAQNKLTEAADTVKSMYKNLLGRINGEMKSLGLPEIAERSDYVTHLREVNSFTQKLFKELGDSGIQAFERDEAGTFLRFADDSLEGSANIARVVRKTSPDPAKTSMRFEISRTNSANAATDVIASVEEYLNPALKRIHQSRLVREIDFAKNFAPTNVKNLLQQVKNEAILGIKDTKLFGLETKGAAQKVINQIANTTAKAKILGSASVAVSNVLSAATNMMVSAGSALRAVNTMNTREVENLFSNSVVKSTRHSLYEMSSKDIGNVTKFMQGAQSIFDEVSLKHAYATGYDFATNNGLTSKAAAKYADAYASQMQAGTSWFEKPQLLNHPSAKAFVQFQSYVMNFFTTIAADTAFVARSEGAMKATSNVIRLAAGMSIANQAAVSIGMRPVYDDGSIPGIMLSKYGPSGALGIAGDLMEASSSKEAGSKIPMAVVSNAVPGGEQIKRVVQGATEPGLTKQERTKAMIFGKSSAKTGKQESVDDKLKRQGWKKEDEISLGRAERYFLKNASKQVDEFRTKQAKAKKNSLFRR